MLRTRTPLLLLGALACSGAPSESEPTEDTAVTDAADSTVDDTDTGCEPSTWYADGDSDGFGDPDQSTEACEPPAGHVAEDGDCNDSSDAVYPGATEICADGQVNDCAATEADALVLCPRWSGDIALSTADAVLTGELPLDGAGWSVGPAGDVNGDGLADLLIGARYADSVGEDAGTAYLVHGPISGEIDLATQVRLTGEAANAKAARWVTTAGDLDGDGTPDTLVSACNKDETDTCTGAVYLLYGAITASMSLADADVKLTGEPSLGEEVSAVEALGDTSGDGVVDLLVGSPKASHAGSKAGTAYIVHGPVSSGSLGDAAVVLTGEAAGDYAGYSISPAGDVNGDGLADAVLGAWRESSNDLKAGAIYVVHGGLAGTVSLADADAKLIGEGIDTNAGVTVSGGADLDGDGLADFFASAPAADSDELNVGEVYLVSGDVTGTATLSSVARTTLVGVTAGDYAGNALRITEDLDGDGRADVLISGEGPTWLLYGLTSGTISLADADARFFGEEVAGDGQSVCSIGDVNGDGLIDIALGSLYGGSSEQGAVYVMLGTGP